MKLIHISDLHLGKRVSEFSMIEDQRFILDAILRCIDSEAPDGTSIGRYFVLENRKSANGDQPIADFLI